MCLAINAQWDQFASDAQFHQLIAALFRVVPTAQLKQI